MAWYDVLMLTLKKVNAEIKKTFPGLDMELVTDGNHYFWYAGRSTEQWRDAICYIYTLNQFEMRHFLSDINSKLVLDK